jgi:NADH-quinone oxidoreductase subunit M
VILSAVYMLWLVQRVYYGPVTNEKNASLPDLSVREWAAALPLVAAAVVMGLFPNIFLKPSEPAVVRVVSRVSQGGMMNAGGVPGRAPVVRLAQPGAVLPVPVADRRVVK